MRKTVLITGFIALLCVFPAIFYAIKSPPLKSLSSSELWFVERWSGDPGVATELFISTNQPEVVVRHVVDELGVALVTPQYLDIESHGKYKAIRVMPIARLSEMLGPRSSYPEIPKDSQTAVVVIYKKEPWSTRLGCWLYGLRWRGTVD